MKNLIIVIALIIIPKIGICQTSLLDFTYFTLRTDTTWQKIELQGIDSYVGGLSNGKDSITFDIGGKKYITGVRFFKLLVYRLQQDIKVRPTLIRGRIAFRVLDRTSTQTYVYFLLCPSI